MERKELHLIYNEKTGSDMYDVAEADSVMDAMEAKIAKLDDAFESCKANLESEKATNEELRERIKELEENLKLADKAELNYKKVAERSLAKIKELQNRIKALKSANEYLENKNSELIEENYTMVARIKELEYQLSDKGRKNSELFATNAELRNRIKELEAKLAHSNDNVDTMLDIADKDHTECDNLEYEKGVSDRHIKYLNNRIKELDALQPKWISVKDRLPKTNLEVLIWIDGIGVQQADFYVEDKGFYVEDYKHPSYWMPLPNPPENKNL